MNARMKDALDRLVAIAQAIPDDKQEALAEMLEGAAEVIEGARTVSSEHPVNVAIGPVSFQVHPKKILEKLSGIAPPLKVKRP